MIPWITSRKMALARCVAVELANSHGVDWTKLPLKERERRVASAMDSIDSWVRNDVVIQFEHDWREAQPKEKKTDEDSGAGDSQGQGLDAEGAPEEPA